MNSYARALLAHRRWVIAITLLVTAILASFASTVKIVIDPAELAPQGHPLIKATNKVESVFGSKYLMLIGITPEQGDIFQPSVLGAVERITRKLETTDGVVQTTLLSLAARQVKGIHGTEEGFEAKPLLESGALDAEAMAQLKSALAENPIYLNTIVSADMRTAAILVELKERSDGFQKMLEPVHAIIDSERHEGIEITLGGNPVYLDKTEVFAQRINLLFPIAILIIGLLHFEAFRTKQGLILPLVTALMAVAWGMGLMGLLKRPMDIFNSPTPILILAVAAGHAVQLLKRYYEEYARLRRESPELDAKAANHEAVILSLSGVGPVMLIAGTVAALGFFSLMVFDIATIRAFGLFTGMGILSALVLEMTFIPAVRSLLPAPNEKDIRNELRDSFWGRFPRWLGTQLHCYNKRRGLYAITALVVLVSAWGMTRIDIDNASKNFFADNLPIQQDDAFLNQQLGGTNSLYIMVEGKAADAIKDPQLLAGIDHIQRFAEAQPHVGKTLSLVDYIKRMNQAMNADSAEAYQLPADGNLIAQYLLLYSMSGEPGDFDSFVDYQYQNAKITVLIKTGSNAYIKTLVTKLEEETRKTFGDSATIRFGGDVAQTIALTDTMVEGKLRNILQIALAIFVISAIAFRSLVAGIIVLVPLALAVVAVFGVMGIAGIPLNIPNSLISAMAVGIGADYAIYWLYRMREEVSKGIEGKTAVVNTQGSAGKAALFVATAVAGGYAVLSLSIGYNVHLWLSMFIVIAMLVSVLASLTLIPALVLSWQPGFIFNARKTSAIKMISLLAIGAALVTLVGGIASAKADELDATTIMQKSYDSVKLKDSQGNATFTLTNNRGVSRVRKTQGFTRLVDGSDDNMRLVRFLSPADIKGTSTLLVENSEGDDSLWVYLPALGKVRRLSASNKKDSFVGTDFSYGDIVGHKPADWQHKLVGSEQINGVDCYVVESIPASADIKKQSGYSKRQSWIAKTHFVALRTDFWDASGRALKKIHTSDVRPFGTQGRFQAMLTSAENMQTGHKTQIQFDDFTAESGVSLALFKPQALNQ